MIVHVPCAVRINTIYNMPYSSLSLLWQGLFCLPGLTDTAGQKNPLDLLNPRAVRHSASDVLLAFAESESLALQ